ncbi:MAG: aminomethyl-transferring glycine dehydrogenase subunit GcvPA [Pirellulales bacterium]|nr:aminomethyl-transferring glycine dehydrogenase subunit GcvPA [Pirellulales bacterium]
MPYVPNTPQDQQAMLEAIGVGSLDELFAMVPKELRLGRELDLPSALGELELSAHMSELGRRSAPVGRNVCFLGGGSYDHFIPAVVDAVAGRGEFYTAYTPYQAEASQGTLQAIFEYQTLITQLTGMDVSNASMYDGATAAVEAVLMATSATRRSGRVVTTAGVHPEYRQTLATYLTNLGTELVTLDAPEGVIAPETLDTSLDDQTACVLIQHPNFFGCLEDVRALAEAAHKAGALFVVVVNPISLGVLARPGEYGADIVVAEGQSLGSPMAFGGPYLGILACREPFVRRMPGRLVGQTTDRRGKQCWVLTLQTREQHIRREKATSNICTNQGLFALRAAVYLAAMGPRGMRQVAELCAKKAHYAAERFGATGSTATAFSAPFFHEFALRVADGQVDAILQQATAEGILAGIPLGRWYPDLADCLLVAVTEKRTKAEIDRLAGLLG